MESIEKLRTAARNVAKGRNLENHEECNLFLIIADEIEREISERYMELPLDADGVPIRVGDVMLDYQTPRNVIAVASDSFVMDGFKNGSFYRPGLACNHSHYKQRTLFDVLAEVENRELSINDAEAEIRELLGVEE